MPSFSRRLLHAPGVSWDSADMLSGLITSVSWASRLMTAWVAGDALSREAAPTAGVALRAGDPPSRLITASPQTSSAAATGVANMAPEVRAPVGVAKPRGSRSCRGAPGDNAVGESRLTTQSSSSNPTSVLSSTGSGSQWSPQGPEGGSRGTLLSSGVELRLRSPASRSCGVRSRGGGKASTRSRTAPRKTSRSCSVGSGAWKSSFTLMFESARIQTSFSCSERAQKRCRSTPKTVLKAPGLPQIVMLLVSWTTCTSWVQSSST
mmetsp:Transcript_3949/g.7996  ORF Transcript_3949/g.7996 Transcript_3949/m.7996 type:complete len:264 (-) Transcript_3949:483-1274(-)